MKKALILSTILLLSDQNTFTAEGKTFAKRLQLVPVVSFNSKNDSFALSPNGRTLAMTDPKKLKFLNLQKKGCQELRALAPEGHNKYFKEVFFVDDKTLLATSSRPEIWDLEKGTCWIVSGENLVNHAQLSPDGKNLLTIGDTSATVWDIEGKKPLCVLKTIKSLHLNTYNSFFWNPNGEVIALPLSEDNAIGVWNHQNPKPLHILSGHTKPVISVAFSLYQNQIATGSFDNTVRLWCIETGRCLNVLEGHTERCRNISFTRVGQVITSSLDGTVRVWSSETGECLNVLEGHKGGILTSAFCQKTGMLATGSQDKTVRIWDIETGKCLQEIHCSGWVDKVCFDNKGERLAIGSGKVDREVMAIQILALFQPKNKNTYFELLDSILNNNQTYSERLKKELSDLRAKEQDKEATIERLWQLLREEKDSPHFDIDKAQFILRQLEYLGVVISREENDLMLVNTDEKKLFPLNEQRK